MSIRTKVRNETRIERYMFILELEEMFVSQKSIAIWMLTKNSDFEMLEGGYSSVLIWKGEKD